MAGLSGADAAQWGATLLMTLVGSGAAWGYLRDRKVAKARGTVAASTVEIQVEGHRVQNLEQRFAFAQKAWDEERESFERRIAQLERELEEEREDAAEKQRHILALEERVRAMQSELGNLTDELASLRDGRR